MLNDSEQQKLYNRLLHITRKLFDLRIIDAVMTKEEQRELLKMLEDYSEKLSAA